MATGNSKTRWNGKANHSNEAANSATGGMQLVYQGKLDEQSILDTSPAECVTLWSGKQKSRSNFSNRLYYGDNLPVLAHLLQDPAVRGQVKLIYIDPPYATGSVFHSRSQVDAYTDLLATSQYVEFLRQRLILLRELLAPDGSIYVHLDENMAFQIKLIMDEVFGPRNFRNWITRKKCNPKNYTRKTYGNVSDFILFYSKTDNYTWNRPVTRWSTEQSKKEYPYIEPETGRRYKKVPVHAPGERNGETGSAWRGMLPPPGKHWQYTPKTLDEMDTRGEIYWSPTGNPRRKVYLDQSEGIPVQDIWLDFRDAHNQNIWITGYPTEKPPALLAQIIEASSNPGDLVLDCFSGSGTTLDVASRLNRVWVGVDNSPEAIATTLSRFLDGLKPMGDFVKAKEKNQQVNKQLSFELDTALANNLENLPPITDFSLYAIEPYMGELESVLNKVRNFLTVKA